MARRKWTPWEYRMIGEWLRSTFPGVQYKTQVRLGKIQPRNAGGQFSKDELALLGVHRRFVDAIVWLPDRLILIEACMRADPGKLSQLDLYERLLPQTPELKEWSHLKIQKLLLYCIRDPVVDLMAKDHDILTVVFVPSFFDQWFSTLRPRHKRAPLNTLTEGE